MRVGNHAAILQCMMRARFIEELTIRAGRSHACFKSGVIDGVYTYEGGVSCRVLHAIIQCE
jgi:hypothetical protein